MFARKGDKPDPNMQLSLHVEGAVSQAEQDEEAEEVRRRHARCAARVPSAQPPPRTRASRAGDE